MRVMDLWKCVLCVVLVFCTIVIHGLIFISLIGRSKWIVLPFYRINCRANHNHSFSSFSPDWLFFLSFFCDLVNLLQSCTRVRFHYYIFSPTDENWKRSNDGWMDGWTRDDDDRWICHADSAKSRFCAIGVIFRRLHGIGVTSLHTDSVQSVPIPLNRCCVKLLRIR